MYGPAVKSANRLRSYQSASYEAILLDQIQAEGSIQYQFLLAVFEGNAQNPFLILSSEKSNPLAGFDLKDFLGEDEEDDSPAVVPGTTYFFCYFEGDRHVNLGSSPEWADVQKFEKRALALLQEKLGETLQPV
ncbi:MAG: hypothetical protein D6722_19315 [Bacteroidetes bacterium]|nr:MAG: hypothetical protein D6722_19315 [Bacteroidota bacterium]